MSRIRSSLALLVGCVWALGLAGTALAADMAMPVKAPPPPPPPPSWWSGFIEVVYEYGQVNPQGQAVYRNGDITVVSGLNLTLYKSKDGFINNATVGTLFIFDWIQGNWGPSDSIWAQFGGQGTGQGDANFYHSIAPNASVTFGQYWTLSDTFFFFDGTQAYGLTAGPPGFVSSGAGGCTTQTGIARGAPLGCLDLPAWYWNELKLSLNDGAITHWPISFNPYVTWYLEIYPSGQTGVLTNTTSAACFSCNNEGTDFIIGMVPKLNIQPYIGIPVTLTAPTWVTVGPSSFWNGNSGSGPGSACIGPCGASSNLGVFSTGLTASLALTWIPAQYGHWSAKAGFQYYDILNNALIADNQVTYGTSFTSHDIVTGFVGLGVGF